MGGPAGIGVLLFPILSERRIDIAYSAIAPSMPLHPALILIECRLASEANLVLFTWMISLMPGTACINLNVENRLTVHVVDSRMYGEEDLRSLEKRFLNSWKDDLWVLLNFQVPTRRCHGKVK